MTEIQYFVKDTLGISSFNIPSKKASRRLSLIPANTTINFNASVIENYLKTSAASNCDRRCYQRYIDYNNELFFGTCRNEVFNANILEKYKFIQLLSTYNELRNQICGMYFIRIIS